MTPPKPSSHHRSLPGRCWKAAASAVYLAFVSSVFSCLQTEALYQDVRLRPTREQQADLKLYRESLSGPGHSSESRIRAAQHLVRMQIPQSIEALDEALRSNDAEITQAVVAALEVEAAAPPGLIEPLAGVLSHQRPELTAKAARILARYGADGSDKVIALALDDSQPLESRLGAIQALGEFRHPDTVHPSVDALITILQTDNDAGRLQDLRDAAFDSLERVTSRGRSDRDLREWTEWWERTRHLPVSEWLPGEVERLKDRVESLRQEVTLARQENDVLRRELDEAMAEVYFALKERGNGAVVARLVEWLNDEVAAVREIALNRVSRIVASTGTIAPEIQTAIASRLDDPRPQLRQSAAKLLLRVGYEGITERAAARLAVESDPGTQRALLEILAQRPTASATTRVIDLLHQPETRDAAALAALRLVDGGLLSEEMQPVLLEAARSAAAAAETDATIRLLAAVGTEDDLNTILGRLDSGDAAVRRMAAEALRRRDEVAAELISRATDPAVYPSVVSILSEGPPLIERFTRLLSIQPPDEATGPLLRDAVLRLGSRLPLADLRAADDAILAMPPAQLGAAPRLSLREAILARALTAPPDALPAEQLNSLLLTLARIRLEMNQPDGVLIALARIIGNGSVVATNGEIETLRFDALLRLGRYDEALALRRDAEFWVQALGRLIDVDLQRAAAVKTVIDRQFSELDESTRAQLERIASRLPPTGDGDDQNGSRHASESGSQ